MDNIIVENSYILNDSLYPNENSGREKTKQQPDGRNSALSFFRYLDSIDKFISSSNDENICSRDTLVCSRCCDQLSRKIEKVYGFTQEYARSYAVVIQEYELKCLNYNNENENEDCDSLQAICPPLIKSKISLLSSVQQSDECETDLKLHIQDIAKQRNNTQLEIEAELLSISTLELEINLMNSNITNNLNHSNKIATEINLFDNRAGGLSVMFDLIIVDNMSFCTIAKRGENDGTDKKEDIANIRVVVNGMRLSYLPCLANNLQWSEINSAWSCVALLLQCIRNKGGLLEKTFIIIDNISHNNDNNDNNGNINNDTASSQSNQSSPTSISVSLLLRPLRRRTLILLSFNNDNNKNNGNNNDNNNSNTSHIGCSEEILSLGSDGDIDCGCSNINTELCKCTFSQNEDEYGSHHGYGDYSLVGYTNKTPPIPPSFSLEYLQRLHYSQAVYTFAAIVYATARDLNCMNCLTKLISSFDFNLILHPSSVFSCINQSRYAEDMNDFINQLGISIKNIMTNPQA